MIQVEKRALQFLKEVLNKEENKKAKYLRLYFNGVG